ncbi:MAG TPA: response regulator transcription factor [Oculatellaceae cyanobacterium]
MAKILYVEDDEEIASSVEEWLSADNHTVEIVNNGPDALQLLRNFEYDVVLLDWQIPGMDGIEVCKQYREKGGKAWIIFLTAKTAIDNRETGLDVGADDYLVKPFDIRELAARVRSALRRVDTKYQPELKIGDVVLNRSNLTLSVTRTSVRLTPRETAVLEFLMRNPNRQFGAKDILSSVWPSDAEVTEGVVRTTMLNLRQKFLSIGKPDFISTIPRAGYTIQTDGA